MKCLSQYLIALIILLILFSLPSPLKAEETAPEQQDSEKHESEENQQAKEKQETITIQAFKKHHLSENTEECSAFEDDHDCDDDHDHDDNSRDGFYWDATAISSTGDDFERLDGDSSSPNFAIDVSYRIQFLGMFTESPGLSSRRIHGLYSTKAFGINFYNSDTWSLDLFKEKTTKGIEGIEEIENRRKDKRSGLRATGYFDNSQLQLIFTPHSSNKNGSDGIESSISYAHNWQFRNLNYYANVGVKYRSKEILDYSINNGYNEIDENSSTGDGLSHAIEMGLEYPLSKHWVLGSFVAYRSLSNRMQNVRDDNVDDGFRAGILLTFVL